MTIIAITFLLFQAITFTSAAELSSPSREGKTGSQTVKFKDSQGIIISLSYDDSYDPIYTMPAYFGSNDQGGSQSTFVLDTTSPYLSITSKDCDNCSE